MSSLGAYRHRAIQCAISLSYICILSSLVIADTRPSALETNYASSECAKVIESNPEAKKKTNIINEMTDEYMLNPCEAKIWFVIELCEIIEASRIELANYELYSSTPKEFTVFFSDAYPAPDWKPIGHFMANDSRSLQTFNLTQVGFGKYIRVELQSHYGNEHYCVISQVKVYGTSMVDDFEKSKKEDDSKNQETDSQNFTTKIYRKRKTSAYRVYKIMMTHNPEICDLSSSIEHANVTINNNATVNTEFNDKSMNPVIHPKPILPQSTKKPNATTSTPLKPSIFVELSNKLKGLEVSLKTQIEEMEKRLMEKSEFEKQIEARVNQLRSQFESFALIMIAYYVYKLILELM